MFCANLLMRTRLRMTPATANKGESIQLGILAPLEIPFRDSMRAELNTSPECETARARSALSRRLSYRAGSS